MGGGLLDWTLALAAMAALQFGARHCRRRGLARLPLRLAMTAAVFWLLVRVLPLGSLPAGSRLWLTSLDDLLVAYAAIRLLVWAGLELPGSLGLWRAPPKLLIQMLSLGGWLMATVVVIRQTTRTDLVGLITTSAVLTAVLGLAAQEPLKDLLAGLELQLSDDFELGDLLELRDGVRGVVLSVSWRDTTLRNLDGIKLVVPNTEVTQGVVRNLSAFGRVSNRFSVGLDYDFPPGRARRLLLEVVRQHPRVLADPAPSIRVKSFDDSAIGYEIQVWQEELNDLAMAELRSDLLEQIWYALKREGQSIPFPIREIQRRRSARPDEGEGSLTPEALCQALGGDSVFSGLSLDQLRLLVRGSRLVSYGPGEAIMLEGAPGESLYHLLRGRVEVLKRMAADRIVPVRQLVPGDVFGEMTLFLNAPRSATVRAVEECLLLRVNRECVRALLEENPDLLERFAALVSAREAELARIDQQEEPMETNALIERMKRLFFKFTVP
jgi:small-conductance mechanosensitive channel